jgi:hypothetical protein
LHIDIDGVDYWIWEALGEFIRPDILIIEYNSIFGIERSITVPYKEEFYRMKEHFSGLYAGASLKALVSLGKKLGYTFVGSNSAGNNAYFVSNEKHNIDIPSPSLEEGYVLSKFRESRNKEGKLTFVSGKDRLKLIKGLPVYNTETNSIEPL